MTSSGYWKLGLFVLLGLALGAASLVYFGSGLWGRSTVDYQVYFDESVQGLDVGSLVRFRGVTVGQVRDIRVAPDARHIRVTCTLRSGDLRREGLAEPGSGPARLRLPPGLRAELALVGLTGQRIVTLDFVDPETHPAPVLSFATTEPTIPAAPSFFDSLEGSLGDTAVQLPVLVGSLVAFTSDARGLLADLGGAELGKSTRATLARADRLLGSVQSMADKLAAAGTPEAASRSVQELEAALARLDGMLGPSGGGPGLVTSARRAADAVSQTSRGASPIGRQLDDTLREAHETLAAIRRLVDALDTHPDMLVKGRAPEEP